MREWLLEMRKGVGITQEHIATKCSITRQYYSMIEKGERVPSVETAQAIANVLGFKWTRFFESNQEAS